MCLATHFPPEDTPLSVSWYTFSSARRSWRTPPHDTSVGPAQRVRVLSPHLTGARRRSGAAHCDGIHVHCVRRIPSPAHTTQSTPHTTLDRTATGFHTVAVTLDHRRIRNFRSSNWCLDDTRPNTSSYLLLKTRSTLPRLLSLRVPAPGARWRFWPPAGRIGRFVAMGVVLR